ncbi:hypothetical protein EZJ55_21965 [Microcystis aeruginosa EAWAG127a]|uniref:Uncharacterized protein n=1 Tax=Microcystis aeruginosa EAWAG127a TaxID=2529855 RepID=A0A5J5M0V1_MICAE|nr:hypothetical protein EZJ55_21965 [Microcystis aeruginosa EAWAG127a]
MVPSTRSLGRMYFRIHFIHRTQESRIFGNSITELLGVSVLAIAKSLTEPELKSCDYNSCGWHF